MAKRYRRLDSGLLAPDWTPDMRPRNQVGSPKNLLFTPGGGCAGSDCYCGCVIFADDFSADDLAADWTQRSGSWSISGGSLATASSNALITCNTPFSATFKEHVVEAKLHRSVGSACRIVFSYDANAGTYNYVEVVWGSTYNTIYIKTSAGVTIASQTYSYDGQWWLIRLCVSAGVVVVTYDWNTFGTNFLSGAVSSTTTVVGLGTGSVSASQQFDDFSLEKPASLNNPTCKSCLTCDGCDVTKPVCNEFLVRISLANTNGCDKCDAFSGEYVVTYFMGFIGTCYYHYLSPTTYCNGYVGNVTLMFSTTGVGPCINVNASNVIWQLNQEDTFDCSALDHLDIPFFSITGTTCTRGPGTCQVTSI